MAPCARPEKQHTVGRSKRATAVASAVAVVVLAGCHHQTPVVTGTNTAARPDARAARARADSIRRADEARTIAFDLARERRLDSLRRATDAAEHVRSARAELLTPLPFDFDRADFSPTVRASLERKAAILREFPSLRIRIEGNADERGSDEYNVALGMQRASAAQRYLVDRGISADRVSVASNGEETPACSGDSDPCWARNRRDEIIVTDAGERWMAVRP